MFGRCPVLVRYMFGILPDKYRTSTEEIADKNRRDFEAILWLKYG
jgi:hypothetical protein